MRLPWEARLGLRFLLGRKGGSSLRPSVITAVLGILFSMAAALICLAVVSGFEQAYQKSILAFNAHVVFMSENDVEDTGPMLAALEPFKAKGVKAATPFLFREGLGVLPDSVAPVVLKGVDASVAASLYPMKYFAFDGKAAPLNGLLKRDGEAPTVVLGKYLFEKFFPGTPLPSDSHLIRLLVPRTKETSLKDYELNLKVAGIFESGLYEFDSKFIMVDNVALSRALKLGSRRTGVEVVLDDPVKAPTLAREIEPHMPEGIQAVAWNELNESLFSAMKMEKTLFFVIMLLILVVASFNVMGVVLMLLLDHTQDAAILRAMGASRKSLALSFSWSGLYLGAAAGICGGAFAALILWFIKQGRWMKLDPQVYFVSELPVAWPFGLWALMFAALLGICFSVSLLAARMVGRMGLVRVFR